MIILLSGLNIYDEFTIFAGCLALTWHIQNIHPRLFCGSKMYSLYQSLNVMYLLQKEAFIDSKVKLTISFYSIKFFYTIRKK